MSNKKKNKGKNCQGNQHRNGHCNGRKHACCGRGKGLGNCSNRKNKD